MHFIVDSHTVFRIQRPHMQQKELFNLKQAAAKLTVSTRTLTRWIREGRINSRRLGGSVTRFTQSDIDDFIARSAVVEESK